MRRRYNITFIVALPLLCGNNDSFYQGELRCVIGQGRLVMAERFNQFSGLVDNCEFKQGEKETTCMDLKGFWEMIYYQVLYFLCF